MAVEVRNIKPKKSAANVSVNANIEFDIVATDGDSIDISTVEVEIAQTSTITGDILTNTYDYSSSSFSYTGSSIAYHIFLNPSIPYDEGMTVNIKISETSMPDDFVSSFTTVNQDLITDFKYAVIHHAQNIPVYHEQLMKNSDTSPTVFSSFCGGWLAKPAPKIRVNKVLVATDDVTYGHTVDYDNGIVTFNSSLDYNDDVDASYNFKFFSDERINQYFKQAVGMYRRFPPFDGPNSIYTASQEIQSILFIGAAQFAFRDLILSLAIQEKRVIFDNRSWDGGWDKILGLFKELKTEYEKDWQLILENKKYKLPASRFVTVPEYTLPGGRSRFFRYLYKNSGSGS